MTSFTPFLAHAGEDIDFQARSTDPGSDDLDLSSGAVRLRGKGGKEQPGEIYTKIRA